MHPPIELDPLLAALAPGRPGGPEPEPARPGQIVTLLACSPPQPPPIDDPAAAAHFHLSAVQAISAGRFPQWWADVWLNNAASAHGADRRWLETNGRRLQDALRGELSTREDRLQELACDLTTEACEGGSNPQAAQFFLVNVVADLLTHAGREREHRLPASNQARAFGATLEAIRRGRDIAPGHFTLMDAVGAARSALPSEGISITDIVRALHDFTATASLAEWLAEAPTKH